MTPAFAQTTAAAAQPGILEMLMPFVLIAVVFYFLLIRPQQKRMKEHRALISSVKRGDTVVTAGGLIGKVTKVTEASDELELDVGNDVRVRVVRSTIADVRGKTQPAKAEKAEPAKKAARKNNGAKKTAAATPVEPEKTPEPEKNETDRNTP